MFATPRRQQKNTPKGSVEMILPHNLPNNFDSIDQTKVLAYVY